MKLFTAIVALAGMSSATASLRGGAVLPSDMKDLLNKLVAADEGTATCPAVVGQMCETLEGVVLGDCPPNSHCNFVAQANLSNWQQASVPGKYCSQPTLEAELVEESEELQDPACKVLGPDNGGCSPPSAPGLSCKAGFTCQGYEENSSGQDPTLGKCVSDTDDTNRNHTPSHAVRCHKQFYTQNFPCSTTEDCREESINPSVGGLQCDARCNDVTHQCESPTFEEEEEELAATKDFVPSADTCLLEHAPCANSDGLKCCVHTSEGYTTEGIACISVGTNKRKCELTTGVEEEEEELDASDDQEDYDDVPADAAHCLPSGAACSLDEGGSEVLKNGKRCCGMTGPSDWTHNGASCNFFNNHHAVTNSDAGAGAYCVYNPGEDLAVN